MVLFGITGFERGARIRKGKFVPACNIKQIFDTTLLMCTRRGICAESEVYELASSYVWSRL
jgi:hypothetical protein